MIKTSHGKITVELFERIKKLERGLLPPGHPRSLPTLELMAAIAVLLSVSLGKRLTIAQAWQAWKSCYQCEMINRERTKIVADVSFWYGVDATKLSQEDLSGMLSNLPRMKAQQRIENGKYDPTDWEMVYNLFLVAYEDEEIALSARANAIRASMNRGK